LLPDNPAPYITDWLVEIGPTVAGSMGEVAIGWQDMAAWERLTGIKLDPWEARTIRRLSRVFANERSKAEKPDYPAPYIGDRETIIGNRQSVAAKIKAAFGANLQRKR